MKPPQYFVSSMLSFAFVLNPAETVAEVPRFPMYVVIELDTQYNVRSSAQALNDAGQVVGWVVVPGAGQRAFLWENGAMIELGTFGGTSQARGINNFGAVVGHANDIAMTPLAFIWQNGVMSTIAGVSDQGQWSRATDINDAGTIIGRNIGAVGWVWHEGEVTTIGDGFDAYIDAWAINNQGQVIGAAEEASTHDGYAFVFHKGEMLNIGTPPSPLLSFASGQAINNAGVAVGWASDGAFGADEWYNAGWVWKEGEMSLLPAGPSIAGVSAYGINDAHMIVGVATPLDGNTSFSFITDGETLVDLNDLVAPNLPWHITRAHDINAAGWIVGDMMPPGGTWLDRTAVLLRPAAPGDLNLDGSVGVADLLILLGAWGACDDCTPGDSTSCPADLDGDCAVGVSDLLILLQNWG